ncbi:hypothetical protein [Synergistes jonesii]|uniref:hypothetical protein n=1 Tax=Synergistes jonesii TaxID=2754 RepID=UPI00159F29D5|nr:hypothetical protein [Synergistes jonesii]
MFKSCHSRRGGARIKKQCGASAAKHFFIIHQTPAKKTAQRAARKKFRRENPTKIFLTCIDKSHYDDYYLLVVGVLALDVIEC